MARRGLDAGQVVDAAITVADADGLEAVTIARVAADLGVRAPSLYNHVASRDALLDGIAARAHAELAAALRDATVGRSGPDAVRAAAHAYRAWAHAAPGRYAAAQRPLPSGAEAVEVLRGVLRAWALEGDAEIHAIRAIRSALHGFAALELGGGFGMKVDLDTSFDTLVDLLATGLGAPPRKRGQTVH